jgi:UDP-N-acetylmuramoyl-tripeptide--D-alanyl-D-alanine ligase
MILPYLTAMMAGALGAFCMALPFVHLLQLESYKRPQYRHHLSHEYRGVWASFTAWWAVAALPAAAGASCAHVAFIADISLPSAGFVAAMALLLPPVALLVRMLIWKRQPLKKPLVFTHRVWRLLAAVILLAALGGLLAAWVAARPAITAGSGLYSALILIGAQAVQCALLPLWLAFAAGLTQPVEKMIGKRYLRDAHQKLMGMEGLIRIGITGSYGKTSVKMILHSILSEKYRTFATPHSYNTPMGVTRAIREQMEADCQVFIAEMGARQRGDIAELCALVEPQYGIITSVGPQHLETFRSVDSVARTKYELIESLPADGMGFFPAGNEYCRAMYDRTAKPKALFGLKGSAGDLYVSARNIRNDSSGSRFELVLEGGETVECATGLLGVHNIENILAGAALAHRLGLTGEEIARGIAKVQPVEHRLQLIPTNTGVTVIDDAFNSNPQGMRAALAVLKSFEGRKIIVTPGLVELGGETAKENRAAGEAMVGSVDIAILVAGNAPDIRQGLLEGGFDPADIIAVGTLQEATNALAGITRTGDVVLFENDLPDHYEQKKG